MHEGSVVVAVAEMSTLLDFAWNGGDEIVLPAKVAVLRGAGKDVESMLQRNMTLFVVILS